jgi:hypothetical protein
MKMSIITANQFKILNKSNGKYAGFSSENTSEDYIIKLPAINNTGYLYNDGTTTTSWSLPESNNIGSGVLLVIMALCEWTQPIIHFLFIMF